MPNFATPFAPRLAEPVAAPYGAAPQTGGGGGGSVPLGSLIGNGLVGWYDPSQLDGQWQGLNGGAPTGVNQIVRTALDRSGFGLSIADHLAATPELLQNGDFAAATGWTVPAGWNISGGVATASGSSVTDLQQTVTVQPNVWYLVRGEIVRRVAGDARFIITGDASESGGGVGAVGPINKILFKATGTSVTLTVRASANSDLDVDNISIKAVPGNHIFTGVTRPTTILRQTGDLYRWEFDGIRDFLRVPDLTISNRFYVGIAFQDVGFDSFRLEHGANIVSNNGFFFWGSTSPTIRVRRTASHIINGDVRWSGTALGVAELFYTDTEQQHYLGGVAENIASTSGTIAAASDVTDDLNIMSQNASDTSAQEGSIYQLILVDLSSRDMTTEELAEVRSILYGSIGATPP